MTSSPSLSLSPATFTLEGVFTGYGTLGERVSRGISVAVLKDDVLLLFSFLFLNEVSHGSCQHPHVS
jgi:hypothetical protein